MERFGNLDNISLGSIEKENLINSLHSRIEKRKAIYQPKPENFLDTPGFNNEEIKKEIALSKSLKEKWQNENSRYELENKKISDVFEGVVVDQFCGEWLANKAQAFFTAEPDDLIRKVDCIIEFNPDDEKEGFEYLGLGIDVTFSSDYGTIRSKLDSIWQDDIKKRRKTKVKYVETDNFKGSLDVCRVVLVTDKETVFDLAKLYKNHNQEELNKHPFLANALSQIKVQLETNYLYSQKSGADSGYLKTVAKTLGTFYAIHDEKKEFIEKNESQVAQSEIFKIIENYCNDKLK